ncbi:tyrosine-type recombinase/integrase [Kyrpidia sp.]|uniref:tyrosine-type recombinase/integrase n=1 Tax=Kyrpidia sp. TaxID=2073077 RepID=UPI00258A9A34|nr:tyrosine-type recombinase/integrase [Kyrpidia sp.]MCL6575548.1 tyrosine-type recombinase/integrase [Kyrpidia sp.]
MAKRIRSVKKASASSVTWQQALDEYLMIRKAEGLRASTLKSQYDVISTLFRRYENAWNDVRNSVLKFMSEDIKPATYNIRLSYLKTFFDWCHSQGYISNNPIKTFKKRKADHRIVQLDEETVTKLLKLPDKSTYAGLRDYALLMLTLDTGIRPKEAFALMLGDVNLRSYEVYVRPEVSKTKISRTLPISPPTARAIRRLIDARHESWISDIPLFASADGTQLNRNTWGDRLEMYSKRLGVHIRPYDLRHTFALYFLRNGGHALALQRLMGHSDLSMTKRYVALTEGDLRQQHDMASPAMKLVQQSKRVRKVRK